LWLHSLKVAQLLRSAACLHTNQSRSYLNHLVLGYISGTQTNLEQTHNYKEKQLDLKLRKLYLVIGRKSQLSLENKLLVYRAILKPIWTYGVQLCGSASKCNIDILEIFESKVLRNVTDAARYVPNIVILRDLRVSSVRQEVRNYSVTYRHRLDDHPKQAG